MRRGVKKGAGSEHVVFLDSAKKRVFKLTIAGKYGRIRLTLTSELQIDGRKILVIGFRQGAVVWDIREGVNPMTQAPNFQVVGNQQLNTWLVQHLGYAPQMNQVTVITEEEARTER